MRKFVVDEVLIENSEKDIKTNVKYSFDVGFNIICGNNEAGKSSLMNFIKNGFFSSKDIDTGKIYFKLQNVKEELKYRADISSKQTCKIFNADNVLCENDFISNYINRRYFEQAFTINLDNLISLQYDKNKTLLSVIKDPCSDDLQNSLEGFEKEISKNLGVENRLKKNVKEILFQIDKLNNEINKLSRKETEYGQVLLDIENLKNNKKSKKQIIEYLNKKMTLNTANKEIENVIDKINSLIFQYNEKLYKNSQEYIKILENKKEYEINLSSIFKNNEKLDILSKKISNDMIKFNFEFNCDYKENDVQKLEFNIEKFQNIGKLIDEQNKYENQKLIEENNLSNIKDSICKISSEIESIRKQQDINLFDNTNLADLINEKIKHYHFLSSEINELDSKNIFILTDKRIIICMLLIIILSLSAGIASFIKGIIEIGIISAFISFIGILLLVCLKFLFSNKKIKEQYQNEQNQIIEFLKIKLQDEYEDLKCTTHSLFMVKVEGILQKISEKINKYKLLQERIYSLELEEKVLSDKKIQIENKLNNINNNLVLSSDNLNLLLKEIGISFVSFPFSKIIDMITLLKEIKKDLIEKENLLKEIENLRQKNFVFKETFNNFLEKNEVKILITENIIDNIENLKVYFQKNNEIYNEIEKLNYDLSNKKINIQNIEKEVLKLEKSINFITQDNIETDLEQLNTEILSIENNLKESEFRKRELEQIVGLDSLKNERNLLLDEYRNIVKNIYKNKLIIEIVNKAKKEFEKNQPNIVQSEKYLSLITGGKYTKINIELEEIENEDSTKIKKWKDLSRGTKEQLFLALRLGYASNYTKDRLTNEHNGKYNLPLIIDDAFVNFDIERTKNVFNCLNEFSKNNQVMFFTCHTKEIVHLLTEMKLDKNINIINM